MNNRKLLFSLGVCIVVGSAFFFTSLFKETARYTPRSINNHFKSNGSNDAAEWIYNIRKNQVTGLIDPNDVLQARKETQLLAQNKSGKSLTNFLFSEIGPDNIGGRTRSIVIDKSNSNIIYVGGVSGGIFKSETGGSSWVKIDDLAENLAVSAMAQDPISGYIYAGTGEGLGNGPMGMTDGNTAFLGKGIYISKDGNTFSLLASTIPTVSNSLNTEFATVNELAVDENHWIYAATNKGLRLSKDTGATWSNPVLYPTNTTYSAMSTDVSIVNVGGNKTVVASVGNKCFISTTGDGNYVNHSTGVAGKLPLGNVSRIELAIAPSDANYIYASVAKSDGNLNNIYRTTDQGANWEIIGMGGTTTFEPLGAQGSYGNTIAVFPNNKDKIILGGIDIWSWELGGNWEQRTLWYLDQTNPYYTHADIHKFTFSPGHPNTFFVGSDGGISKSIDGGKTFSTINKNFSVTQFYTVSCSRSGDVIGGTQDNGTILVNREGNNVQDGMSVMGGDGGGAAISIINPSAYFATTYYAGTGRSPDKGTIFYPKDDGTSPFFSPRMLALGTPGGSFPAAFVTPLLLWESFDDIYSPDSVIFKAKDTAYAAGEIVQVKSKNGYLFSYQLPISLSDGQQIKVHDKIQSKFYLGTTDAIWMTREALDFGVQPKWFKIAALSGQTITMAVSKDGMYIFAGTEIPGTTNGNIYRISNLRLANDSLSADVLSPYMVVETKLLGGGLPSGRTPTSVAVDPNNANNVIVTYGNYGNTLYVYMSTNALSQNPTFIAKQGNLPKMPVYTSLIEMYNSSLVIIGTEYGIYATENIQAASPVWVDVNANGLANVPVYMLKQQVFNYPGVSNYGVIYAATHGRGIFESRTYMGINDNENAKISSKLEVSIYPNPVKDRANVTFNFKGNAKAILNIYDIQGRLKKSYEVSDIQSNFSFDCSNYAKGTYFIQVLCGNKKASAKFVVY